MFTIKVFPLGPLEMNSHIIHNTEKAIIIDIGGDPRSILQYAQQHSLEIEAIYITHLHFDHIYGLSALAKACPVPIYVFEEDMYLLNFALVRPEQYGLPPLIIDFEFSFIPEGKLTILGEEAEAIHCPGHTLGSLCYYIPKSNALFAGDVLFHHTVGRTDLPGGDHASLQHSIKNKLFCLPNNTVVYPGHGRTTTIGHEKEYNPAIEELE